MAQLKDLSKLLNRRIKQIEKKVDLKVKVAMRSVVRSVIPATPADTGTAISSWIATKGAPANFSRRAYVPGELGDTKNANVDAAIRTALPVISSQTNLEDLYLTNNVDYINDLNRGTSQQAPEMFVQRSIVNGIKAQRNVRLLT